MDHSDWKPFQRPLSRNRKCLVLIKIRRVKINLGVNIALKWTDYQMLLWIYATSFDQFVEQILSECSKFSWPKVSQEKRVTVDSFGGWGVGVGEGREESHIWHTVILASVNDYLFPNNCRLKATCSNIFSLVETQLWVTSPRPSCPRFSRDRRLKELWQSIRGCWTRFTNAWARHR